MAALITRAVLVNHGLRRTRWHDDADNLVYASVIPNTAELLMPCSDLDLNLQFIHSLILT